MFYVYQLERDVIGEAAARARGASFPSTAPVPSSPHPDYPSCSSPLTPQVAVSDCSPNANTTATATVGATSAAEERLEVNGRLPVAGAASVGAPVRYVTMGAAAVERPGPTQEQARHPGSLPESELPRHSSGARGNMVGAGGARGVSDELEFVGAKGRVEGGGGGETSAAVERAHGDGLSSLSSSSCVRGSGGNGATDKVSVSGVSVSASLSGSSAVVRAVSVSSREGGGGGGGGVGGEGSDEAVGPGAEMISRKVTGERQGQGQRQGQLSEDDARYRGSGNGGVAYAGVGAGVGVTPGCALSSSATATATTTAAAAAVRVQSDYDTRRHVREGGEVVDDRKGDSGGDRAAETVAVDEQRKHAGMEEKEEKNARADALSQEQQEGRPRGSPPPVVRPGAVAGGGAGGMKQQPAPVAASTGSSQGKGAGAGAAGGVALKQLRPPARLFAVVHRRLETNRNFFTRPYRLEVCWCVLVSLCVSVFLCCGVRYGDLEPYDVRFVFMVCVCALVYRSCLCLGVSRENRRMDVGIGIQML